MFKKYFESGYSIIPLVRDQKRPRIADWSKYCETQASETEIETWERLYNIDEVGIGVCLGFNDLVAIDYDIDDKSLRNILPPSPVQKTGKKDRLCSFYRGKIQTRSIKGVIDVLSHGRQTVLPSNSLHPDTKKPYVWLTPDTLLDVSVAELPEITEEDVEKLLNAASKLAPLSNTVSDELDMSEVHYNNDPSRESPHNSQARLKKLCAALVASHTPVDESVNKLLEFDNEHHKPVGYFTEQGRTSDQKGDPYTSALAFYTSCLTSINKKRAREGLSPEVPHAPLGEDIELTGDNQTIDTPLIQLPEPYGVMKLIYDDILLQSPAPQPTFALAAALCTMSAFALGRYTFQQDNPSIFCLLLAKTGHGKEAPKSYVNQILTHERVRPYNLLGLSRYISAPAFLEKFPTQRTRLDIVDEFSTFLKAITRKEGFQREIAMELAQFYSFRANQYFSGSKAISRKETYECYGPALSLMALCQPETFTNYVTGDFMDQGSLPRFLMFYVKEKPAFNKSFKTYVMKSKVNDVVKSLLTLFPNKTVLKEEAGFNVDSIGLRQVDSTEMGIEHDAQELISSIGEDLFYRETMYSRALENITRVAMLACLSRGDFNPRGPSVPMICKKDVEWARDVVLALIDNASGLVEIASTNTQYEKAEAKYIEFFKSKPKGAWVTSDRYASVRHGLPSPKLRDELLKELVKKGIIEKNESYHRSAQYRYKQ